MCCVYTLLKGSLCHHVRGICEVLLVPAPDIPCCLPSQNVIFGNRLVPRQRQFFAPDIIHVSRCEPRGRDHPLAESPKMLNIRRILQAPLRSRRISVGICACRIGANVFCMPCLPGSSPSNSFQNLFPEGMLWPSSKLHDFTTTHSS